MQEPKERQEERGEEQTAPKHCYRDAHVLGLALRSSGMLCREDAEGHRRSSASHHAHTNPVYPNLFPSLFFSGGWEGGEFLSPFCFPSFFPLSTQVFSTDDGLRAAAVRAAPRLVFAI